jgi:hypothetical protein
MLIYKNAFVYPEIDQGSVIIGFNLQLYSGTIGNFWSDHTDYGPYDFDGYTDLFPIIDINDFWNYFYENYVYLDDEPPLFLVSQVSGVTTHLTAVTIEAEIEDMLPIEEATLGFSIDNQNTWNNISMIPESEGKYYCTIPAGLPEDTMIFYQIVASDLAGNIGVSLIYNFTTASIDLEGPIISSYYSPEVMIQNKEFTITAIVEDESIIENVTLYYSIDGGVNWIDINMTKDEQLEFKWLVSLSIETETDNPFMYYIEAFDEFGNLGKTQILIVFPKTNFQVFFDNPITSIGLGALVSLALIGLTYAVIRISSRKKS